MLNDAQAGSTSMLQGKAAMDGSGVFKAATVQWSGPAFVLTLRAYGCGL